MKRVLRGIAVAALLVAVAQSGAILIESQEPVGKVEPSQAPERSPPPSEEPTEPPPSVVPSPEATPAVTPEPPPVIIAQPIAPPPPAATPPPPPPPPSPGPTCTSPGGSGESNGQRKGWPDQPRSCAGKQDAWPLALLLLGVLLWLRITDPSSSAPCLVCRMPASYPLHGPPRSTIDPANPDYAYHAYDPGERRKRIRRMADRIGLIERRMNEL